MIRTITEGTASRARCRFNHEDFEQVGLRVAERRYGRKDLIFAPGDPDDQLCFLLEGTVRLYKLYGGYKEATVALLHDGGVFGGLSLEEGGSQNVYAEVVTDARVAKVRKHALTEAMRRSPELTFQLFSSLSERLRQSDEVVESLLEREVSSRLATLLANLGDRFGDANGGDANGPSIVLEIRLTHQDLANMIFSTREAVSKAMSEFQREGLIEVRNRRIAITPLLARTSLGATIRN